MNMKINFGILLSNVKLWNHDDAGFRFRLPTTRISDVTIPGMRFESALLQDGFVATT
jgi:hypothetical protein